MRRFLFKMLIFSVGVFILSLGLDGLICRGLLCMEDYRFQDYRAMLDGGMDNDILIMGNSRGKSHYDPFLIDSLSNCKSFCIGIGGYPLNVQLIKYKLYLEHNRKPRIIIQDIDYATMGQMTDVRYQHQSEQFFPLVFDRGARNELKSIGYRMMECDLPLYRMFGYQQVIKEGLLESLSLKHYISRPAYKGHRPEEGVWNGRALDEMEQSEVVIASESRARFENYLAQCKKDSVYVVLVYSPMYNGAKEKLIGLDDVRQYFSETANRFGFPYLDYLDHPICRDTNNFVVSVHMNPQATQFFTRQLMKDIDSLSVNLPSLGTIEKNKRDYD